MKCCIMNDKNPILNNFLYDIYCIKISANLSFFPYYYSYAFLFPMKLIDS